MCIRGDGRRIRRAAPVVLLVLACAASRDARALTARLRWRAASDARVTGYQVYVRLAGETYGSPLDVGMPPSAADGTITAEVSGLRPEATHHFAVRSYLDSVSDTSALSAELVLGGVDPCRNDYCWTPTTCDFSPVADGTPCDDATPDQCGSTCVGGTCSAASPYTLETRRLKLRTTPDGVRIAGLARFSGVGVPEPASHGVSATFSLRSGVRLGPFSVPASALRRNATGSVFRLDREATEGAFPGIERLVIRRSDDTWTVRLRIFLRGFEARPDVVPECWIIRMGAACAGDFDVTCEPQPGPVVCH